MNAQSSNDQAGEPFEPDGARTGSQRREQVGAEDTSASPYSAQAQVGDEEARLNARRLSLTERWRRALGEPSPDSGAPSHLSAPHEEFWEAREMSGIWAQAERDPALLSLLREEAEEASDAMDAQPVGQAVLDDARARFQSRMRAAGPTAAQVLARGEAEDAPSLTVALTIGEVVEAMEHEERAEGGVASWRPILEPVRTSRQPLPAHITGQAMRAFWDKMGVSIPREVSTAFNQAARLLLMGRADSGVRLSLARSARPSGISHAIASLATEPEAEPQDGQAAGEPRGEDNNSGAAST